MPELPEVENIRRSLAPHLLDEYLTLKQPFHPQVWINPGDLPCRDVKVTAINRRGKYLDFVLDSNLHLVAHLRLTGRFTYTEDLASPCLPHTHVIFAVSHSVGLPAHAELRYSDPRRFGRLILLNDTELKSYKFGYNSLGAEPLSPDFTPAYLLTAASKHPHAKIKSFLLDQTVIAGLGNIYADEILYACRLHPCIPVGSISEAAWEQVVNETIRLLSLSIANHGTTFRDYRDGDGKRGGFQSLLCVYGRAGQACPRCNGILATTRISGRSTVYCPQCQAM